MCIDMQCEGTRNYGSHNVQSIVWNTLLIFMLMTNTIGKLFPTCGFIVIVFYSRSNATINIPLLGLHDIEEVSLRVQIWGKLVGDFFKSENK